MENPSNGSKSSVRILRAPVGSIRIYEVKDSELETLEKEGSAATQLNFAVAAFSVAFSAFGTLVTATIESDLIETFYVVAVVAGLSMGTYCLVQWKQSRASIRKVIADIRNRMDEDTTDDPSSFVDPPAPPSPTPPA